MAESAIDVHRFVITERLPGPHPHGKAGEDGYGCNDRECDATSNGAE